jgi:hypothetical protein
MGFIGIGAPAEFRTVTRAHLIAWRKDLERRTLARATIRRKLSALSSLFQYLCEKNAVAHNPVDGVKRPTAHVSEGATPALSDAQARTLLNAPREDTLKGKRDRAILATLLYHGLRRAELCQLKIKDLQQREGVAHLRVVTGNAKLTHPGNLILTHPSLTSTPQTGWGIEVIAKEGGWRSRFCTARVSLSGISPGRWGCRVIRCASWRTSTGCAARLPAAPALEAAGARCATESTRPSP